MGLKVYVLLAAGLQCHRWVCGLQSKIMGVSPGPKITGFSIRIGSKDLEAGTLGSGGRKGRDYGLQGESGPGSYTSAGPLVCAAPGPLAVSGLVGRGP